MIDKYIQQLYKVFSRYEKPDGFQTCECCVSEKDRNLLLSKELVALNADELSGYAADVFLTVGDVPDFKYFVPRILDLCVRDEFSWPDHEIVLSKLSRAGWDSWPAEEQQAIMRLLEAKYGQLLQEGGDNAYEVDGWVCALGRCVPDVTPYLDQLSAAGREAKLAGFVALNRCVYTTGKLYNAFWEPGSGSEQRAIVWLNQPKVEAVLSGRYGVVL